MRENRQVVARAVATVMSILTEIIVGAASLAFVVMRLRSSGSASPPVQSERDAFRPAAIWPEPERRGVEPPLDVAVDNMAADSPWRDRDDKPYRAPVIDPTSEMMDAMAGPGVCTPRA